MNEDTISGGTLIYVCWLMVGIIAATFSPPYEKPCRAAVFAMVSWYPIYFIGKAVKWTWKWLFGARS